MAVKVLFVNYDKFACKKKKKILEVNFLPNIQPQSSSVDFFNILFRQRVQVYLQTTEILKGSLSSFGNVK